MVQTYYAGTYHGKALDEKLRPFAVGGAMTTWPADDKLSLTNLPLCTGNLQLVVTPEGLMRWNSLDR